MSDEPLVRVYESQGIYPAEVIKAKLEANGIPVLLRYESVGQIIGITVDGLGRVDVYVPADRADEAMALVDEDEEYADETDAGDEAGLGQR